MRVYLAGPMSGIPQFNFPEFHRAAILLRNKFVMDVVSPAELDAKHGVDKEAMASTDGDASKLTQTWGDLLARDVKMIADDGIQGIVFLKGWQKSRGARLEASVGLLCNAKFFELVGEDLEEVTRIEVAAELFIANANSGVK